jgi:hypothetical protein
LRRGEPSWVKMDGAATCWLWAMSLGTLKIPTLAQLGEVAGELGLNFSEADRSAHREALQPSFEAYNVLDQMSDELPAIGELLGSMSTA